MRQKTHLKPLKPEKRAKFRHATFDIETRNWTEVVFVGFYDGYHFKSFSCLSSFLDYLFKDRRYWGFSVYAHNGGKFDFLPLLEELQKRKEEHRLVDIHGAIAQVKLKHRRLEFRDSLKLLTGSLKKLAEAFEVETQKGEIDFETEEFDPKNPEHVEYNRRDCIALYQVIEKFSQQEFIKEVKLPLTTASLAMKVFRTCFLKTPVKITNQETQDFCRRAYFGGRVEIFKTHGEKINVFDVNSLYPFTMKKPLPLTYAYEAENWKEFGFHDVTVEVPESYLPVLPTKVDIGKNTKLVFPTGTFRGVYFSEELKLAVSRGAKILKFHSGKVFEKSDDFFHGYVDTFYEMRQKFKGTPIDHTAKLMLNALYGKWGEREEKSSLDRYDGTQTDFDIWRDQETFEKTKYIVVKKQKRSVHQLVHIAAAITAYARMHLFETMLEPNQENLYYCDTDSGFIDSEVYQKTDSKTLGAWKLESPVPIEKANFRLPKVYALKMGEKWVFKAKGFPKNQLKNMEIEKFLNSSMDIEYEKPLTLKNSLIRGGKYFSAGKIKKSILAKYDKRIILPSGDTRPLKLCDGKLEIYP